MEELLGGKGAVEAVGDDDGGIAFTSLAGFNEATTVVQYDNV